MKLIIDVDEKIVFKGFEQPLTEEERATLIRAIGNGRSYNPSEDCISREALKKDISEKLCDKFDKWNKTITVSEFEAIVVDVIDNASAVVPERPKGKWVEKEDTPASVYYCCSNCDIRSLPITPFCPWCGAEMEGDEE